MKIEIGEGKESIKLKGSSADITSDVIYLVHRVYELLRENDEWAGEMFKDCITSSIDLAFTTTPEELSEACAEHLKCSKGEFDDAFNDFMKSILD